MATYLAARSLLETVVEGSRTGRYLDLYVRTSERCLVGMDELSRAIRDPSLRGTRSASPPIPSPYAEPLKRAKPYVQAMVAAIRRGDRDTALKSGESALDEWSIDGS